MQQSSHHRQNQSSTLECEPRLSNHAREGHLDDAEIEDDLTLLFDRPA
jgi:hypothetical protein